MAKLLKPIVGCSNGEIYPREYPAGEECPEDLVTAARAAGALAEDKAVKKAPETK